MSAKSEGLLRAGGSEVCDVWDQMRHDGTARGGLVRIRGGFDRVWGQDQLWDEVDQIRVWAGSETTVGGQARPDVGCLQSILSVAAGTGVVFDNVCGEAGPT